MKQTQVAALVFVALFLGIVIGLKIGKTRATPPAVPADNVQSSLPRLVDLGSTTCIPCKKLAPILEELKTEYRGRVSVEFIDVTKNPAAADEYKINVIPTQIFIDKDGKEVFRHEGFYPKADIVGQFEKMDVSTR
jgi:thioredoxin 1